MQSRGHASIRVKKVKGHATAAMLEAGLVEPEDKDGNDWADAAAGKGTNKFSRLATMARKFSIRNERYKKLMASIHKFIITMLKAHKEEEEARKKQMDPFDNKEYSKQQVAKRLEYADEEGRNERICFAQLPQHAAVDEDQRRSLEEVRNFFTHLQWKVVPDEQQQ